jgi:phosphoribosylformimino-5-aminoimidazole carboxamide ribotide isomerase
MNIYPAIDLRGGKVVRLREGDPEKQTIFSDDPLHTAQRWLNEGATWLHVVNLDGAFNQANDNSSILEKIAQLNLKVQFGGGLRTMPDIENALQLGAARVVIGTAAVENPDLVLEALEKLGADRICVALDARDGKITTHGWTTVSEETPVSLGRAMAEKGVQYALYTDVKRDGSMIGANLQETISLARQTGLKVIASGGVTNMPEIATLAHSGIVEGAIIGMALYKGEITLQEALLAAQASS